MKRAATKLINGTRLKERTVSHVKLTENIEPRYAGCPADCPNIDQVQCYWTKEIVLKETWMDDEKSVLACLKPGRMILLDSDYLEEVKHEMGDLYCWSYKKVNNT